VAKKRRAHDQEAWKRAKQICRLSGRQVEMARRLGMNPKKLPDLRPGPQERWKLPVGEFIEDLYLKRFGPDPHDCPPYALDSGSRKAVSSHPDADAQAHAVDAASQVEDLVCYFRNLADDLRQWRAHGFIDPQVMQQRGLAGSTGLEPV
jgi:hypothetical protein